MFWTAGKHSNLFKKKKIGQVVNLESRATIVRMNWRRLLAVYFILHLLDVFQS